MVLKYFLHFGKEILKISISSFFFHINGEKKLNFKQQTLKNVSVPDDYIWKKSKIL